MFYDFRPDSVAFLLDGTANGIPAFSQKEGSSNVSSFETFQNLARCMGPVFIESETPVCRERFLNTGNPACSLLRAQGTFDTPPPRQCRSGRTTLGSVATGGTQGVL